MSARVFQSVVLQFKDPVGTEIGVIDAEGTIIACTELSQIGHRWPEVVAPIDMAEGECVALSGRTFKALSHWDGHFDFAVYAQGDGSLGRTTCAMAAVVLNTAKNYYEEKHDKISFVKSILSDNILLSDLYTRAKELHVETEQYRGVFVIRRTDERGESVTAETVQAVFSDRQASMAFSMGEKDIVLIQQVDENATARELETIAKQVENAFRTSGESVVIGIGTVAVHLRDLAKSYKEAQIAIEVGKVFETEKSIINYENLGIGRLIYQLPTTLCEMFLQEVFKKNPVDTLDKETLFTINKFFENNLVLSKTARKLFVHRNTLVYRLEKIKKLTGLDLREFDDAITFKVALMVKRYLASRGIEN